MTDDREERVGKRAYEIWEREGRPHGEAQRHWDQASTEIDAENDLIGNADGRPIEAVVGAGPALAKHSKDAGRRDQ